MHPLLKRQIKHHLGENYLPDGLHESFLQAISDAYTQADEAHLLIEHSLDEMSTELTTKNRELQRELNERRSVENALQKEKEELAQLLTKLEETQNQLLQAEKMASIGQLAAGVAHEINNPIGYVNSNLGSLREYCQTLLTVLTAYEDAECDLPAATAGRITDIKLLAELPFLKEDIFVLMNESDEGISRVRKIVQDLKDFSRVDDTRFNWADLQAGLESTLNIVHSEIKYKADVVKAYTNIPKIECAISQLNQVFMNLLVNAAQSITGHGTVTIRTGSDEQRVWVEISDTGQGIAPENLGKIFDPFFTTKPVGKGTGLGLSMSYGIVKKHHGKIEVDSQPQQGTTFRVILPIRQPENNTEIK